MKKRYVMPLLFNSTKENVPPPIHIPGTRTIARKNPQEEVAGASLVWDTPAPWTELEYERVQREVRKTFAANNGMDIDKFALHLAEELKKNIIPGRHFSLTMASFQVEYDPEKES